MIEESKKFVKVTKRSGMMLMYILDGNKYYGGIRYSATNEEEGVKTNLANMYQQGELWDATDEVNCHRQNGRKVEELD